MTALDRALALEKVDRAPGAVDEHLDLDVPPARDVALEMMVVEGIKTSIPMHLRILADPDFRAGKMSTGFMERFLAPAKSEGLAESA